jgi:hypothetical protein
MLTNFYGGIKVDRQIKPLKINERVQPPLFVGSNYYVSFMNNNAYPCTIIEIINEFEYTEVKIEIPVKSKSKKGAIDENGNLTFRPTQTNIVYASDIGLTPEDAVRNQVR